MTDRALEPGAVVAPVTTDAKRKRIAKRYAAERRFKALGIGAVLAAVGFLVLLLSTVIGQGLPAFTYHRVTVPIDLTAVDPANPADASYRSIVNDGIAATVPFAEGRTERRAVRSLISGGNEFILPGRVADGEFVPGQVQDADLLVDDFADLYLKGLVAARSTTLEASDLDGGAITASDTTGDIEIAFPSDRVAQGIAEELERMTGVEEPLTGPIRLASRMPSVLLYMNGGVVKVQSVEGRAATGTVYVPLSTAASDDWSLRIIRQAEANRKIDDRSIVYLDYLEEQGRIENGFNTTFFTGGASREPELAGIWGAVVGSFLTLVVTLLVGAVRWALWGPAEVEGAARVVMAVDITSIALGYGAFALMCWRTLPIRGLRSLRRALPLVPLYWLLMSFAVWRAAWQPHRAPNLWEKTPHEAARRTR